MARRHRWLLLPWVGMMLAADCSASLIHREHPIKFTTECVSTFEGIFAHEGLTCATLEVPVDWGEPDGPTIDIVTFRLEPKIAPTMGDIWLLDGGPGGSGVPFLNHSLVEDWRQEGWRVYVPSHRGALHPRLECGEHPAASTACYESLKAQWGDDLRHFNTEQAAHDLHGLMEAVPRIESSPLVVFGMSYGGFWAEEYVARHPGEIDGLILDSPLPGDVDVVALLDEQEATFLSVVSRCTDDPNCAGKAGYDDAETLVSAMKAAVDERDCGGRDGGLWEQSTFARRLGDLTNQSWSRDFVPLLVAMLADCDEETGALFDLIADKLLDSARYEGSAPPVGDLWGNYRRFGSDPLGLIVLHNSVLSADVDIDAELAQRKNTAVSLGTGMRLREARHTYGQLPSSPRPDPSDESLPVLVLTGRYDLQTPLGTVSAMAERIRGPLSMQVMSGVDHFVTGSQYAFCPFDASVRFASDPTAQSELDCDRFELDPSLERADLAWRATGLVPGVEDPWSLVGDG